MELKLCYKSYPVEMTLGAIKRFSDATGKDLWVTLLEVLLENEKCKREEVSILERMIRITKVAPFDLSAELFHSMIKPNLNIPLDEIRDGMARVGWLPNETDKELAQPYGFALLELAYDLNKFMEQTATEVKKKAAI